MSYRKLDIEPQPEEAAVGFLGGRHGRRFGWVFSSEWGKFAHWRWSYFLEVSGAVVDGGGIDSPLRMSCHLRNVFIYVTKGFRYFNWISITLDTCMLRVHP